MLDIKSAYDAAIDWVGLSIHHDTITGTSPQETIADYKRRLAKAQKANNVVYSKMLQEEVRGIMPVTQEDWLSLDKVNAKVLSKNDKLVVLVHNPSAVEQPEFVLKGIGSKENLYNIEAFDVLSGTFQKVESLATCLKESRSDMKGEHYDDYTC